ncbi:hypothetical protein NQZ68_005551 [Dissostichus eleginoides]|nr:hypothetical protein NQZ68_005551 [Dissostichus eleginoides]
MNSWMSYEIDSEAASRNYKEPGVLLYAEGWSIILAPSSSSSSSSSVVTLLSARSGNLPIPHSLSSPPPSTLPSASRKKGGTGSCAEGEEGIEGKSTEHIKD